ncbi:MAG TPA: tRNA (adenosine(37)-N6)-dimethylallyltransferase MiaA [Chitinophagaceae bacterium]|nr:tRNA (adenosine(37)-N6)-dimethylallyltransferase MiaA [Chitinophagaceae bacterium]
MNPSNKTVIIICGPTAVGKTSVSIALAKYFHSEIISADSRQCFRELKIGVARPTDKELEEAPHHFIASHSITENINAAFFEQYALQKTNELFKDDDTVVMVGGTGLYIKAFCDGLDEIPAIDESIRKKIIEEHKLHGLSWLQEEVKKKDPEFYKVGEVQNPQRMMRALEVVASTGKSILEFRKNKRAERNFKIIKIGLELSKEDLYNNINSRVDKMIKMGLVEEVRLLKGYSHVNALQTVGYSEIFEHFDGKMSLATTIEEIKKNTRQYAKRQMTWFKKDKEINWVSARQTADIISMAQKLVGQL